jgi:hypothetical protein
LQAWRCAPVDSGQVQLPSSPRGYYALCKIIVHLNWPHTVLYLNRTHIPAEKARHRRAFSAGWDSPPFVRAAKLRGAASVRFPRPKIGELAHQAKGAGNFAEGEYPANGMRKAEISKFRRCISGISGPSTDFNRRNG